MTFTDKFNQLAVIISEQLSVQREDITLDTRLREDLKTDVDDVDELLCKIAEQFEIDWHGFVFYRYFHEEPHLFSLLFDVVLSQTSRCAQNNYCQPFGISY